MIDIYNLIQKQITELPLVINDEYEVNDYDSWQVCGTKIVQLILNIYFD